MLIDIQLAHQLGNMTSSNKGDSRDSFKAKLFHNQVFESINSAWTQEMETEGVALREGIDQEPSSPEGCRQSPLTALP